ncbi:hypothetical protein WA026_008872, partial [Henosepilachna vigintioctopunctata]
MCIEVLSYLFYPVRQATKWNEWAEPNALSKRVPRTAADCTPVAASLASIQIALQLTDSDTTNSELQQLATSNNQIKFWINSSTPLRYAQTNSGDIRMVYVGARMANTIISNA